MSTSTDPIADMLTRIRNAINARKTEVSMPHSKAKEAIARLLAENRFVTGVQVNPGTPTKELVVTINSPDAPARITELSRISKPGRRLYAGATEIPSVKRGRGMVIISTSKGMMTGLEARTQRLGGELICKVY